MNTKQNRESVTHRHQFQIVSVLGFMGQSFISYACDCGKTKGKIVDRLTKTTERK